MFPGARRPSILSFPHSLSSSTRPRRLPDVRDRAAPRGPGRAGGLTPVLLRLLILAGVALAAWAAAWALRRYAANARTPQRFDHADGGDFPGRGEAPLLVTFSGPYCIECEEVRPRLEAASSAHRVPLAVIDIKRNPELALKYDVRLTPTTLVVGRSRPSPGARGRCRPPPRAGAGRR